METISIVGGGLAGLIAAIECAERGSPVRVLEARSRLGGRASSSVGPFVANLGPHALYTGGSLWEWLRRRDLHHPARMPRSHRIRFRSDGARRLVPPRSAAALLKLRGAEAPVGLDFRTWVADRCGDEAAEMAVNLSAALTFDHDPGRLSAAFVWERVQRIGLSFPPSARYVVGGWTALVDRLADRARSLGVLIETGCPVDSVAALGTGRMILAVEPRAARRLLADPTMTVESPTVALVDVGLQRRRGDPYLVLDLDEPTFTDRFTAVDRTLAPTGHDLVQAMAGLRPGESLDAGVGRIEAVLDAGFAHWRDRVSWRRRGKVRESTGALDLPGTTWRDRPPIAYADDIWVIGDWVAAPGHLAEVSCASAVVAAREACRTSRSGAVVP